jgi:hypothetical protein
MVPVVLPSIHCLAAPPGTVLPDRPPMCLSSKRNFPRSSATAKPSVSSVTSIIRMVGYRDDTTRSPHVGGQNCSHKMNHALATVGGSDMVGEVQSATAGPGRLARSRPSGRACAPRCASPPASPDPSCTSSPEQILQALLSRRVFAQSFVISLSTPTKTSSGRPTRWRERERRGPSCSRSTPGPPPASFKTTARRGVAGASEWPPWRL